MKHYANAEDAAKDQKFQVKELRFYEKDGKFGNRYRFGKNFTAMTAQEKIQEFYKIHTALSKRGIRATDIVMTADVSMLLMTDPDFLEYYDKLHVNTGEINQRELPEGVSYNGSININGVVYSMFTYDETFEDLDGKEKEFLPAGTIAFLRPGMGTTVYAQVTFVKDKRHVSHAEKIVPRIVADEANNIIEVQMFSRPVPYPLDWDGWMVANIYDPITEGQEDDGQAGENRSRQSMAAFTAAPGNDEIRMLTEEEIGAISTKKEVIEYAASIGLSGLSDKSSLSDLKDAVISYQQDLE